MSTVAVVGGWPSSPARRVASSINSRPRGRSPDSHSVSARKALALARAVKAELFSDFAAGLLETTKRQFELGSRLAQVPQLHAGHAKADVDRSGLGNSSFGFRLSKKTFGNIPSRAEFPTRPTPDKPTINCRKPLTGKFGARRESARAFERGLGLVRRVTLRPQDRLSVVALQLDPPARLRL